MDREETLDTAKSVVCGEREGQYGCPEDNFNKIAALWSAYCGMRLNACDVAAMMVLLKVARIETGRMPKADNWVDIAGYAACGAELEELLESAKAMVF